MSSGEAPGRGVVGLGADTDVTLLDMIGFCSAGVVAVCLPPAPAPSSLSALGSFQADRENWYQAGFYFCFSYE